jgi:hypothetical protein
MVVSSTRQKIDQVLASARKDLEVQLGVVRADMARLIAEEQELIAALGNLARDGKAPEPGRAAGKPRSRSSSKAAGRKATARNGSRPRRRRGASKPTAERVEQLRTVLAEGPASRSDLAASLKVSPARVQQLLEELGSSVSSRPNPGDRRGKLWGIKGARNGASAPKRPSRRSARQGKAAPATKPRAGRAKTAK